MSLSPAQLTTLQAAIQADPTANVMFLAQNTPDLTTWCNAQKPGSTAWATSITPESLDSAATYLNFDSLVAGKRDSWKMLVTFNRDPSLLKIRNWVADVWGANDTASVTADVLAACTELATNAQTALGLTQPATVTGATRVGTSTLTAGKRNFTGSVTQDEISRMVAVAAAARMGG